MLLPCGVSNPYNRYCLVPSSSILVDDDFVSENITLSANFTFISIPWEANFVLLICWLYMLGYVASWPRLLYWQVDCKCRISNNICFLVPIAFCFLASEDQC